MKPSTKLAPRSTASLVDSTEYKKIKIEDIRSLEEISKLIDNFLNTSKFNTTVLDEISRHARNLKFKDSLPSCIRNKYGMIDRSRASALRSEGLEITYLEALGRITDNLELQRIDNFSDDLKIIKQKIALILKAEKDPKTKTYQQVLGEFAKLPATTNFTQNIAWLYVDKLAKRIVEEAQNANLASLDFKKREDRYYFGNSLLKIGELSRELIEFANYGKESGLFSFLKKIRNEAAHSSIFMTDNLSAEQEVALRELRDILQNDFSTIASRVQNSDKSYNIKLCEESEKNWQKNFMQLFFSKDKDNPLAYVTKFSFNAEHFNLLTNDQKIIAHSLIHCLDDIVFIKKILENSSIDEVQKQSIIEFAIVKIANSLNDANKSGNNLLENYGKNAIMLRNSWLETVLSRNQKIAHGVIDSVPSLSLQDLAKNITAIGMDLNALLRITTFRLDDTYKDIESNPSDYRHRRLLIYLAKSHLDIGNDLAAREILEKTLSYFDSETPILDINKISSLKELIYSQANHDFVSKILVSGQYFEQRENFENIEIVGALFAHAISHSNITQLFDLQVENGVSLSKAIESLSSKEQEKIRVLIAADYFDIKHQILAFLTQTYKDRESNAEILNDIYNKMSNLEKKFFGYPLDQTLLLQGNLMNSLGDSNEALEKFRQITIKDNDNLSSQIEYLVHFTTIPNISQSEARLSLQRAEELSNRPDADSIIKIKPLVAIVKFESENGDFAKASLYLKKLKNFFKEHQDDFRGFGNRYIDLKESIIRAEICFICARYSLGKEVPLIQEDIELIDEICDDIKYISDSRGKDHDYNNDELQSHIEALATTLDYLSLNQFDKTLARNLSQKSKSILEMYQTSIPDVAAVKEITDITKQLGQLFSNKNNLAKIHNTLDDLYDKIISFDKNCKNQNFKQSESFKGMIKDVSDMIFYSASETNHKDSYRRLTKSFILKDLFQVPKNKKELRLMALCKSCLTSVDKEKNVLESIKIIEEAKLLPVDELAVEIGVHKLAGDLYHHVGDFSEAIKNYRFVLENIPEPQLKEATQTLIANSLAGAREEKIKFKAIEDTVLKAYQKIKDKSTMSCLTISNTSITTNDLKKYLQKELKVEQVVVNKLGNRTIECLLDDESKEKLNKKIEMQKQSSLGR